MESTWERRDLPVLDAVVRYFDEHDGAEIPDVATFGSSPGWTPPRWPGRSARMSDGKASMESRAIDW
jgi:hypothetical protein